MPISAPARQQRARARQPGAEAQKPRGAGVPVQEVADRMLGAALSEMDEDWSSRRWFTEDSIALTASPTKAAVSAATYDDTHAEDVRRVIEVVVADNPIKRRVA